MTNRIKIISACRKNQAKLKIVQTSIRRNKEKGLPKKEQDRFQ